MMLCYNCTLEFFKVVIRPVTLSPDSIFSIFFFFFFFFFSFLFKGTQSSTAYNDVISYVP